MIKASPKVLFEFVILIAFAVLQVGCNEQISDKRDASETDDSDKGERDTGDGDQEVLTTITNDNSGCQDNKDGSVWSAIQNLKRTNDEAFKASLATQSLKTLENAWGPGYFDQREASYLSQFFCRVLNPNWAGVDCPETTPPRIDNGTEFDLEVGIVYGVTVENESVNFIRPGVIYEGYDSPVSTTSTLTTATERNLFAYEGSGTIARVQPLPRVVQKETFKICGRPATNCNGTPPNKYEMLIRLPDTGLEFSDDIIDVKFDQTQILIEYTLPAEEQTCS